MPRMSEAPLGGDVAVPYQKERRSANLSFRAPRGRHLSQNAPMYPLRAWFGRRDAFLVVLAIGIGLVIAYVDASPKWDDTGITATMLLLMTALISGISARRPWLWAILVGAWIPILEFSSAGWAGLIAIGVAAVGATAGYLLARVGQQS